MIMAALVAGGLFMPERAYCRLSAEADLNYVNYDVRNNAGQHLSANSLTQRYSILYDINGKFMNGRMGMYDVSLGYEWATFDTSIKSNVGSTSPSASDGHIMYSGDVLIDPKEFPFKLHMFSHDISRASWTTELSRGRAFFTGNPLLIDGTILPNLTTGIQNGQHIESGATLVMGVKNGMTNGYNEVLRHFPMLMLDYRDQINKDLSSSFPENNRLSRLAFVSLNKKDNWFHYRYMTYKDYINSSNNFNETQIQLGTIDQTLQRRWIDFSNWLQVSADGQLSKRVTNASTTSEEFALNLFATARRQTWEARTFNNFTRLKENVDRITYKTSVPVYVSGIFSPTSTWNAYVTYNDNKTNKGEQFTSTTAGYQANAFSQSEFTLRHGMGIESATSQKTTGGDIVTAVIGTTSTARFSRVLSLGADYNIRHYMYDTNGTFTDHSLNANARYVVNNQLQLSLNQSNNFTSGRSRAIGGNIKGVSTATPQYFNPRDGSYDAGSSYQSVTSLSAAWNPLPRLNVSFLVSEDIYVPAGGQQSTITRLENTVTYNSSRLMFSSKNLYSYGNSSGTYSPYTTESQLSSLNIINYLFSRSLDARLRVSYYKWLDQPRQSDQLEVEQNLNYYYYQKGGMARKLFEINETFKRRDGLVNYGSSNRNNEFTLGAKYFPLRQLLVGAGTKYYFANRLDDYSTSYYATISMQFRLLEASLDYSYGKSSTDGRIEKRFSANMKKRF